jgi:uncharacterized membrane protein
MKHARRHLMNGVLWLNVLHVGTAMLFVAGLVGRSASFGRAAQAQDIHSAASLLRLSEWFERTLVIPAYFGVLVSGVLTARAAGWPLWSGLADGAPKWPLLSLVLFLSPWLFIPTYLAPRRKRRAQALADALSRQIITLDLTSALRDRGVLLLRRVEFAMTAVVMVLMVAKPF